MSVAVAAEVGAAHNISHARAHSLVHTAVDLHRRLPQVMAAMRRGAIDYRIVATINTRTQNVDDHYLELLDHALAARAEKWMKLSDKQLIDRIDMTMDVPRLRPEETAARGPHAEWAEASEDIAARYGDSASLRELVERAAAVQRRRYAGTPIRFNAELSGSMLMRFCRLSEEASRKLVQAYGAFALSARAHDKVLRVARTIADLEGAERIEAHHMNEALLYRAIDFRIRRLREGEKLDAAGSGGGAAVFEGRSVADRENAGRQPKLRPSAALQPLPPPQ